MHKIWKFKDESVTKIEQKFLEAVHKASNGSLLYLCELSNNIKSNSFPTQIISDKGLLKLEYNENQSYDIQDLEEIILLNFVHLLKANSAQT